MPTLRGEGAYFWNRLGNVKERQTVASASP